MRSLIVACVTAASAWLGGVELGARQAARSESSKIDVSKLGPQVGERVPDFSLPDQAGRTQTLESITGSKGAMLVFVRSADW